jgi:hypothetical protein
MLLVLPLLRAITKFGQQTLHVPHLIASNCHLGLHVRFHCMQILCGTKWIRVIIFGLVWFLSKKITILKFIKKKSKPIQTDQFQFGSVFHDKNLFGSVFLVLAWFFRFGLIFFQVGSVFFGLGSIRFFQFFQNFNRFNQFFFMVLFFQLFFFSSFLSFLIFILTLKWITVGGKLLIYPSDSFEKDCSYLQSDWAFKAGLLKNLLICSIWPNSTC